MSDRGAPPGTPLWVKVFGVIGIVVVLVIVIILLIGRGGPGGHGPGRHTGGGDTPPIEQPIEHGGQ